jgi:diaminopimelate epimerase
MKAQFHKYTAMGNDMIVIDPEHCDIPMTPGNISLICDRHYGVGADGICYGPLPGANHPRSMRFFNPDGSEAAKSGNGLRAFARYLRDAGVVKEGSYTIAIGGDVVSVQVQNESASSMAMKIGRLSFGPADLAMVIEGAQLNVTAVSIGNPHAVIFTDRLDQIQTLGPLIETSPLFPDRTNVQLVQLVDRHRIRIEIWERGAGYTLASGTSCSAAAGAAVKTGRCVSPVTVEMAGGVAQVTIGVDWQVELVGSIAPVYQATFSAEFLNRLDYS